MISFLVERLSGLMRTVKRLRASSATVVLIFILAVPFARQGHAQSCPVAPGTPGCEAVGPGSNENSSASRGAGDPIDVITGNNYQRQTDHVPRPEHIVTDLVFVRHYSSANVQSDRALGPGWSHSYQVSLWTIRPTQRQIVQSDGRRIVFDQSQQDSSRFYARNPADGYLAYNGGFATWYLRDDRQMLFDANGWLERIRHSGGQLQQLSYDHLGRVERVTNGQGDQLTLSYYPKPDLARYRPGVSSGRQQLDRAEAIASEGRLQSVTLSNGGTYRYRYDGLSNLVQFSGPHFNHAGRESSTKKPEPVRRVIYHYDDENYPHALTGVSRGGLAGETKLLHTWRYDEQGRTNHYHRAGTSEVGDFERVDLKYLTPVKSGQTGKTVLTNSLGQKSIYTWRHHRYDAQFLLLRSEGPGCSACPESDVTYQYNARNQLVQATRRDGVSSYKYDTIGRLVKFSFGPAGRMPNVYEEHYVYESSDAWRPNEIRRPSVNSGGAHVMLLKYNSMGQPISVSEQGFRPIDESNDEFETISRTTSFTYADGLLVEVDGPRTDVQDVTRYAYNKDRRIVSVTGPDDITLRVSEYDEFGRPTKIRRGRQDPISVTYTSNGLIDSATLHGVSIQYSYDVYGNLTAITGPDGHRLTIEYNEFLRPAVIAAPDGRQVTEITDSEGRMTQRSLLGAQGGLTRSIRQLYDVQGRLIRRTIDGRERNYAYDKLGRLEQISNGAGDKRRMTYNSLRQLTSVIDDAGSLRARYNRKGQVTHRTDENQNTTRTVRDDFGRVVIQINPDTGRIVHSYDNASNLRQTRSIGRNGEVATFTFEYDAADRLLVQAGPDRTVRRRYESSHGRLESVAIYKSADGQLLSTQRFSYNSQGSLSADEREIDGLKFVTQFTYDSRQRLLTKTLPDGQVIRHHYWNDGPDKGELRAITRQTMFGWHQETIVGEIGHSTQGTSTRLHGNGIADVTSFDERGRVASISASQTSEAGLRDAGADGLRLEYTYNEYGDITGIDFNRTAGRYGYDVAGRLTAAFIADGNHYLYHYDLAGNRTASVHDSPEKNLTTVEYEHPKQGDGNRLTAVITTRKDAPNRHADIPSETSRYIYAGAGSPLSTGKLSYQYSSEQRPTKVYRVGSDGSRQELIAQYQYNGFGERIRKTIFANGKKSSVTYYIYDDHILTAEANEQGKISAQYLYLDGYRPIAKLQDGSTYAVHTDNLGAPHLMTDVAGNTVWKAGYRPFGRAMISVNDVTMNLRRAGQYEDVETGSYYNNQRDYDPDIGRYLTSDPIGLAGGMNLFAYVKNNPLALFDPRGESPLSWLAKQGAKKAFKKQMKEYIDDLIKNKISKIKDPKVRRQFTQEAADLLIELQDPTWWTVIEFIPVVGDICGAGSLANKIRKVMKNADELEDRIRRAIRSPGLIKTALLGFQRRTVHGIHLTKERMKHFLERHHPDFWNGTVKSTQTFFKKGMSVDDVADAVTDVMRQNGSKLRQVGPNGRATIEGVVNGVRYRLQVDGGNVVQFFPL